MENKATDPDGKLILASLIGFVVGMLVLFFPVIIVQSESPRNDSYSIALTAIDGVTRPAGGPDASPLSPAFNLTLYVKNTRFIGENTRYVSYGGVAMGEVRVPGWCAGRKSPAEVEALVRGKDVQLSAGLRRRMEAELRWGTAELDVEATLFRDNETEAPVLLRRAPWPSPRSGSALIPRSIFGGRPSASLRRPRPCRRRSVISGELRPHVRLPSSAYSLLNPSPARRRRDSIAGSNPLYGHSAFRLDTDEGRRYGRQLSFPSSSTRRRGFLHITTTVATHSLISPAGYPFASRDLSGGALFSVRFCLENYCFFNAQVSWCLESLRKANGNRVVRIFWCVWYF